jgi:FMN phosphatase YigB (HAD superfamily)
MQNALWRRSEMQLSFTSMEPINFFADIRVIGFDLDQTLYPKSPLIDEKIQEYLYQKIAEYKKVSIPEAEKLFKERYREGAGMSGSQTLKDLGLPKASELVQEALEHADIASILLPDRETNKFLADIRARYEGLDLITGSNMCETQKKLKALGLNLETFSHVITADQSTKSTGDSYRLWLSLYPHLQPQQFLYVGDRIRSDHEIPSALGIKTVLVYVTAPDSSLSCLQYSSLKDFFLVSL